MKFVFVVLFFSEILMASPAALRASSLLYDMVKEREKKDALKNANFEYCLKEGTSLKENKSSELSNFLDLCISNASNNLEGNKGARGCLKVAKLGNQARLTRDCMYQVGYQICRDAENDDFYNRLKCMAQNSSTAPYASCDQEVSELKKQKKEKSLQLSAFQAKQFQKITQKDFCETPARSAPPSPDEGSTTAPGQR